MDVETGGVFSVVRFQPEGPSASAWRPAPALVRAVRGDYLGMFAERGPGWFTAQYCGISDGRRAQLRLETLERGYTHFVVTYAFEFSGHDSRDHFDFGHNPERFRTCLNEILADHLVPVTMVVLEETFGREPSRAQVEPVWRQIVDVVGCDRMPVQVMGWEWDDFVRPADRRDLVVMAHEACPDTYLGVHFTPDRWAGSPSRDGDSGADDESPWEREGQYWRDMQTVGVDALFFQSGERGEPGFTERLREIADRLQGRHAAYPRLSIDLVAMEYCDPHNQSGLTETECRAMGQRALTIPGVVGFLNGGPGTATTPCPFPCRPDLRDEP